MAHHNESHAAGVDMMMLTLGVTCTLLSPNTASIGFVADAPGCFQQSCKEGNSSNGLANQGFWR